MRFGLINMQTVAVPDGSTMARIANALQRQLYEHYAPWWETEGCDVILVPSLPEKPVDVAPIFLMGRDTDPDVLGDHFVDMTGLPIGRVDVGTVLDAGGSWLDGADSISCVASHEVIEMRCDPYGNFMAFDGNGAELVAQEPSDPVQDLWYTIDGVTVSNFVGPRWFRAGVGPYDYLGQLTAPFTHTAGGYVITENGPQGSPAALKKMRRRSKRRMRHFEERRLGRLVAHFPE
jgi:hypothetical protein